MFNLQTQEDMYRIGDRVKVYGQVVEIDDLLIDKVSKEVELIYLDECISVSNSVYTRDWCRPHEIQEHYPKE